MDKMLILPAYSEFNRLVESTLISSGNETISIRGFECIFDSFEKIYSLEKICDENVFELFHKIIDYHGLTEKNDYSPYKTEYREFLNKVFKKDYLDKVTFFMEHVPNYSFFSDICREFFINNFTIKPYKNDYEFYKEKYFGKKVVCINGRNALYKTQCRNDLLLNLIKNLIEHEYYVINTTIYPPGFQFDNYEEISPNLPYNDVVALYNISECVISIQNAGGISTHLLTESNFILLESNEILLSGQLAWVNNKNFGFNNKTQVELRSEKGYFTKVLNENDVIQHLKDVKKPNIKKFSDESKIIYK
jgi:hypothetical protein